eukprot:EG_transcript_2733
MSGRSALRRRKGRPTDSEVADTPSDLVDSADAAEQSAETAAAQQPGEELASPGEDAEVVPSWLWRIVQAAVWVGLWGLRLAALAWVCRKAYTIRLHAVRTYGYVIHEFDPWFNYRATEYLERNGLGKFLTWYDTQSWSPLGRPVGTTIFPGMQVTSVLLFRCFQWLSHWHPYFRTTLNDVCVLVPAWFGAVTSLFTGLLAWEASGSANAGVAAAAVMAVLPAHLMRSVAGGYDNESVAMTALCCTFWLWIRALRPNGRPILFGILTGLSYFYMVAAWGGYVFVLNVVGLHAASLILLGRLSPELYYAYSCFYVVGTIGALQIPVVGWNPLRSAEQLGPMGVGLALQLLYPTSCALRRRGFVLRWGVLYGLIAAMVVGGVSGLVWLQGRGFVWEFSTRIKSLFIKHTKTGNPLVDSVAEHQSTPLAVYVQYLHHAMYLVPVGFFLSLSRFTDASLFLVVYGAASSYFALKMIRLVLLCAPAVSAMAGIALVVPTQWALRQWVAGRWLSVRVLLRRGFGLLILVLVLGAVFVRLPMQRKRWPIKYKGFPINLPTFQGAPYKIHTGFSLQVPVPNVTEAARLARTAPRRLLLRENRAQQFLKHADFVAEQVSEPHIMLRGNDGNGNSVIIDDFREAYHWLRDNTPANARVMAWWDYGYQITGIGNRTSIADGNTWNHEHIALLGRCLVSSEAKGHAIIRHLADYVLLWTTRYAGMYSDDLAKSPHMARISGSVYPDINPAKFYIDQHGQPSRMMQESVLYRLHSYRLDTNAGVGQLKHFAEAYTTRNRMVRIYKVLNVSRASKRHPFGTYPPALQPTLSLAKDFSEVKRLERLKAGKFD